MSKLANGDIFISIHGKAITIGEEVIIKPLFDHKTTEDRLSETVKKLMLNIENLKSEIYYLEHGS